MTSNLTPALHDSNSTRGTQPICHPVTTVPFNGVRLPTAVQGDQPPGKHYRHRARCQRQAVQQQVQHPQPPGQTMLKLHSEQTDMRRLPNPGDIFPHPTSSGQYAMMCNKSAYEDHTCPSLDCQCYHFPVRLSTHPADIKGKLKTWDASQPHVS